MAGLVEEAFQRDEPFAPPQPYTATKTRPVRAAQDPIITAAQCVCPKRGFAPVQRNIADSDRQLRTFHLPDRMNPREPLPQLRPVDLVWCSGRRRWNPVWVSVTQSSTVSTA